MNAQPQHVLERLTAAGTMGEIQERLAEFLGLDRPVPEPVLHRALTDRPFLHHLIVSRGCPEFLRVLFADPRNNAFQAPPPAVIEPVHAATAQVAGVDDAHTLDANPGSLQLVARAAGALARWGSAGIGRVEPAVFDRRWNACVACPHLVAAPEKLIYKVGSSLSAHGSDPRVCSACGCVAQRKAKLPTERCPRPDPERPELNRWGQPRG